MFLGLAIMVVTLREFMVHSRKMYENGWFKMEFEWKCSNKNFITYNLVTSFRAPHVWNVKNKKRNICGL